MKLQQIEYLNEIFNITFTLRQTLYLIQIAKKKITVPKINSKSLILSISK